MIAWFMLGILMFNPLEFPEAWISLGWVVGFIMAILRLIWFFKP